MKNVLNLFTKGFLIYNITIIFLLIPLTILLNVTKNPFFLGVQIMEMILLVINAVYIVFKVMRRKDL